MILFICFFWLIVEIIAAFSSFSHELNGFSYISAYFLLSYSSL